MYLFYVDASPYKNVTEEWYVIRVNGEELRCTAEHPFYVVKRDEFVPARNLKKGDELLQSDGRYGIIETVEIEYVSTPEATYNFEVAEYHTYYVGNGILTHNKCRRNNKLIPNSQAKGAHTTFGRDPISGKITKYATYEPNSLNPSGFDQVLRFDRYGAAHNGVSTPHIHTNKGVRHALFWEIPI